MSGGSGVVVEVLADSLRGRSEAITIDRDGGATFALYCAALLLAQ